MKIHINVKIQMNPRKMLITMKLLKNMIIDKIGIINFIIEIIIMSLMMMITQEVNIVKVIEG